MSNSLGIQGYDYIEFYVGSAKMTASWYQKSLGFELKAYCGPETGCESYCSYYLVKNEIKIVITSSIKPEAYDISHFLVKHGDGVKRWSVQVDSVRDAFERATKNVAVPVQIPIRTEDDLGWVEEASIKLYDDLELVFFNSSSYKGVFKPGFQPVTDNPSQESFDSGLLTIDHIVGNVRENEMEYWSEYMNKSLDFETFLYFGPGDISTQYSSLLSKVVHAKDDVVKNPINEPFEGARISQIEEFIEEFHGTGVQHIALKTNDIIKTIRDLRSRGIEFISVPDSYFDHLSVANDSRQGKNKIKENIEDLRACEILCDLEGEGYLLQTFMKPISDRPTFFYEIIQRCEGAKGFGQGNFKSLFEAIEKDQALRGHLTEKVHYKVERK